MILPKEINHSATDSPCLNDAVISSVDINNISVSHNHNEFIHKQSLSVPLAQQSVSETHLTPLLLLLLLAAAAAAEAGSTSTNL